MEVYNEKILIVDSEIETRRLLDEQLTTAGYKTVLSTNGRDGLNSFFNENPDLVEAKLALGLIFTDYGEIKKAEKYFKKAISYGLNMNQDLAMAKLSLAGILMQKRRKREAILLLNEAKKLDKHGILAQQIKLMQTQMKRI